MSKKENKANEIVSYFKKSRTIPNFVREAGSEFIENLIKQFTKEVAEVKRQEEEQKRILQQQESKLKEIVSQLEGSGLTIETIVEALTKTKQVKSKALPKYQYTDDKGNNKTWTGIGKKPLPIQKALETGGSLEDFLINK